MAPQPPSLVQVIGVPTQLPPPSQWSLYVHAWLSLHPVLVPGQFSVQVLVPLQLRWTPQVPGPSGQTMVVPPQVPEPSQRSS
jgi:hypothetical protein